MAPNRLQPSSQESRTPTVAKECQIVLYDPSEADLALFIEQFECGNFENGCKQGIFLKLRSICAETPFLRKRPGNRVRGWNGVCSLVDTRASAFGACHLEWAQALADRQLEFGLCRIIHLARRYLWTGTAAFICC